MDLRWLRRFVSRLAQDTKSIGSAHKGKLGTKRRRVALGLEELEVRLTPALDFTASLNGVTQPLEIAALPGSSGTITTTTPTWVVIQDIDTPAPAVSMTHLAEAIQQDLPSDQVLTLGWTNPDGDTPSFDQTNWVVSAAAAAASALSADGFSGTNLNLVGEGWGAYVADEMAKATSGGVNSILALDPGLAEAAQGYDPEASGVVNFAAVSKDSWVFRAAADSSASTGTPQTAAEAFVVTNTTRDHVADVVASVLQLPTSSPIRQEFDLGRLVADGADTVAAPNHYADTGSPQSGGSYDAVIDADDTDTSVADLRDFSDSDPSEETTTDVTMATQDFGGLQFESAGNFNTDAVTVGEIPSDNDTESAHVMRAHDATNTSASFTPLFTIGDGVSFDNSDGQFVGNGTVESDGGESVQLFGAGDHTFNAASLLSGGLQVTSANSISVAGVQFTLDNIQFQNDELMLQGSITFTQLGGLQAAVTGDNYVIIDSSGIHLTGLDVTLPSVSFSRGGVTVAAQNLQIQYSETNNEFSFSGTGSITVAGQTVGLSLGSASSPGVVIENGQLESFLATVTTPSITIGGLTLNVSSLTLGYSAASSDGTTPEEFIISGTASVTMGGSTATVELGDSTLNTQGLVIRDGSLYSLDMAITGSITEGGLTFQANELEAVYSSSADAYTFSGGATLTWGSNSITATLAASDGLVIQEGTLESADMTLSGSITEAGFTFSASNLHAGYTSSTDTFTLSGSGTLTWASNSITATLNSSDGLTIKEGTLTGADLTLSGTIVEAGLTFTATDLHAGYSSTTDSYTLSGSATLSWGSNSNLTVSLATSDGVVIKEGALKSVDLTLSGSIIEAGLSFTLNDVTVAYHSSSDTFTLSGSATLAWNSDTITVTLAAADGLVIKEGVLQSADVTVNGSLTVGGLTFTANSLNLTYASASDEYTIAGGAQFTLDGSVVGVKFGTDGTHPGLVICEGVLVEFDIALTTDIKIGGLDFGLDSLEVAYADNTFTITGGTHFSLDGNTVSVEFNSDGDQTGLVISNGKLESLDMSVTSDFSLEGLTLDAQDLTIVYAAPTSSDPHELFELYGSISVTTSDKVFNNVSANLGTASDPGIVLQDGSLESLNIGVTGSINLFGLTVSADDLAIQYSTSSSVLEISGGLSAHLTGGIGASFDLTNGGLSIDTSNGAVELGGLSASVTLPGNITVSGSVDFVNGQLNEISLSYSAGSGEGIPLGDTGLFITSLNGGVDGLATHDVVVSAGIGVTFGKSMTFAGHTYALFTATGQLTVSAQELDISANVQLIGGYLGSGSATLSINWAQGVYKLTDVDIKLYDDIFEIQGDLIFDNSGDITLMATANVNVPDGVPFIGGDTLAGIGFYLQIRPDESSSDSLAAAWVHIKDLGTIGIEYDFDKKLSIIHGKQVAQFQATVDASESSTTTTVYEDDFIMVSGVNAATFEVQSPDLSTSGFGSNSGEMMQIWEFSASTPLTEIGAWNLEPGANDLPNAVDDGTGTDKFVMVGDPTSTLPINDQDFYQIRVISETPLSAPPTISMSVNYLPSTMIINSVTAGSDGSATINYNAYDYDPGAINDDTISLYYSTTNSGYNGHLIATVPYTSGTSSYTWADFSNLVKDPSNSQPYYFYAVLNDPDTEALNSSYSNAVFPSNPYPTINAPSMLGVKVNGVPEPQVFSTAENAVTVSQQVPESINLTLSLSGGGTLTLPALGRTSTIIVLTGLTQAQIKSDLNGMIFTPGTDFTGLSVLTITAMETVNGQVYSNSVEVYLGDINQDLQMPGIPSVAYNDYSAPCVFSVANGNPLAVTQQAVTPVTAYISAQGGTLSCPNAGITGQGEFTLSDLSIDDLNSDLDGLQMDVTPGYQFTAGLTIKLQTVVDGVTVNSTYTIQIVNPFAVSGLASTTATAGTPFTFTLTASNSMGNKDPGYSDTVHFTSSDALAGLPADYTFTAADQGAHTFTAILKTAGSQSITVTDTNPEMPGYSNTLEFKVVSAAATSFQLSSPSTAVAGNNLNVTLTAYDSYGNVATNYTGTVHFSSNDSQAHLPSDYTFQPNNQGTQRFALFFGTAGSDSLTIADTAQPALSVSENVVVSPTSLQTFKLGSLPATASAGSPLTFTVSPEDRFGNVIPTYTGTIHFSSNDTKAGLPANYTFTTTDAGCYSFSATFLTAGNETLYVADSQGNYTSTQMVAVSPLAAVSLGLSAAPAVAGTAGSVTVTAYDIYGNVATGYTGTVVLSSSDQKAGVLSSSDQKVSLPITYTFTAADQGKHTFNVVMKTAGSQSLTVTDNSLSNPSASQSINVSPAPAASVVWTGVPTSTTAGIGMNVTVTVLDPYGNVASGYVGTIQFTSSDTQAMLPSNYTFAATDAGTHTFGVALLTAGSQTLSVADTANSSLSASQSVAVTASSAMGFRLTSSASTVTAGSALTFTATAIDRFGNVATGYTGTVFFTSNDNQAILPGNYTFTTAADAGVHNFSITLRTANTRSVTIIDKAAGFAATQSVTVNAAAASVLRLTAPATTAGATDSVTVKAFDDYGNPVTAYTGRVHFTSNDPHAALPSDYVFSSVDQGQRTFNVGFRLAGTDTLTVTDLAGGFGASAAVTVSPGTVASFVLVGPSTVTAGSAFSLEVKAVDAFGNVVTGYTGGVSFSSSDTTSTLPQSASFTSANAGDETFTGLVLRKKGQQSIRVVDTATGNILGTISINVQ